MTTQLQPLPVGPLTTTEQTRLTMLEEIVQDGLQGAFEAAEALSEIKTQHLWRQQARTWEEYLETRWKICRSRGYQLLNWVQVVTDLSTVVDINERQSRELEKAAPEDRQEVWDAASANGEPTAERIKDTVDRLNEAKSREEKLAIIQEEQDQALRDQERELGRSMVRQLAKAHQFGQRAGGEFNSPMQFIRQTTRLVCNLANLDVPPWAVEGNQKAA